MLQCSCPAFPISLHWLPPKLSKLVFTSLTMKNRRESWELPTWKNVYKVVFHKEQMRYLV